MNRVIFTFLAAFMFGLIFQSNSTLASGNCKPIYGGGEACLPQEDVLLDKKVQHPLSSEFVDSLGQKDAKYKSGEVINFQISITNQTGKNISVEVKDSYPTIVREISGPGETIDAKRSIAFKVVDLKPKETRKFVLIGKIGELGKDACFTNHVQIQFNNARIDDNSSFCVEAPSPTVPTGTRETTKGGLPVKKAPPMTQTPPTGPGMLSMVGLASAAGAGLFLRKRIKI